MGGHEGNLAEDAAVVEVSVLTPGG